MKNPRKSAARLAVVQALYEMDIRDEIIRAASFRPDNKKIDKKFFEILVGEAPSRFETADAMIRESLAENWSFERLEAILKAVLRTAIAEFFLYPETPAPVIISEYVGIAARFFDSPAETGFVNAALDKISKRIRGGSPNAS